MQLKVTPFRYQDREIPQGHLLPYMMHPGCHALFFYATMAVSRWYEVIANEPIILEEDPWPDFTLKPFENMLRATQWVYNIGPEKFLNYWEPVEAQLAEEGILVPPPIKFDNKVVISIPGVQ